jgi:hypothetical protein
MRTKLWGRRMAAGVIATVAVTLVGGTAFAAWHSTGAGTSTARAGTTSALTATASITGTLRPGGPSRDLAVTITNPNTQAITVTAIALNGTVTNAGGSGTCATTGVTVTLPGSISLAVPANSTRTYTATGAVTMSTASESGCQGATFTVPLAATGRMP